MIYTFYSFKGGVGRSMALANVAELLYKQGLRVLIIDFDLEAPGLEGYFNTPEALLKPNDIQSKRGVIDLLLSYKELRSLPSLKPSPEEEIEHREIHKEFPYPIEPLTNFITPIYESNLNKGSLSIIPAGIRYGEEFTNYAQRVRSFDWDDLYTNWNGEQLFEWFRLEAERVADCILIDSRTGVTEMSGVCTYQLADVVVMFVSPNQQNLDGTLMMARSLSNPKLIEEGRNGRPLSLVFVPSRVEHGEAVLLDQFAKQFDETLAGFNTLGLEFEKNAFVDLKIPYVPYYAFMENVAVREPERASAADLIQAFEKLVTCLTQLGLTPEQIAQAKQLPETEDKLHYNPSNYIFFIPFRSKGDQFIGREAALEALHMQLTEGRRSAIGQTAVIQGLGGLGKTQLAVEYAYRFKENYPNGVIWLNADQDINAQLIELTEKAKWIAPESDHRYKLAVALQRLKTFSDCLIVFDNLESLDAITDYLPEPIANPHILVTSRIDHPELSPIPLEPLNESSSMYLLTQEAGRNPSEGAEETAAYEIIMTLGGLPLALEIAGAYLRHRPISWRQYRNLLVHNVRAALPSKFISFTQHEVDLYSTLGVDEEIFAEEPRLRDILDLLTWSGPTPMGHSLICALLDIHDGIELTSAFGLGTVIRLLQKTPDGERYAIHRLVQGLRREEIQLAKRTAWVNNICEKIGDWFQERKGAFADLPQFEAEIDHLKAWQEHALSFAPKHSSRLTWLQGYPPYQRGHYPEAKVMVEKSLELFKREANSDRRLEANQLEDLSRIHSAIGNYKSALSYADEALSIRLDLFGEQHAETAVSLDNLSNIYVNLGDNKHALDFAKRALSIRLELFGEHHPDTSDSLSNLGRIYRALGDQKRALEYTERALYIQQQVFGEQHPHTAASINSISNTYRNLGDYKRALEYAEKSLAIRLDLLGERHPDTAASLSSIAAAYRNLGDHKRALEYAEKSLAIRLDLLGERHPDTAISLNNISSAYQALGNYNQALQYAERALKIRREFLGDQHPDSIATIISVSYNHVALGQGITALSLLDDTLQKLNKEHPSYSRLKREEQQLRSNALRPGFRQPPNKSKNRKSKKK